MSTLRPHDLRAIGPGRFGVRQAGLSLVELVVAILIALFLIGGVMVVEQGVHRAYGNQSGIGQLQDEERFAMSMLTTVISSAGYYPNPTTTSTTTAFPVTGAPLNMQTSQAIYGPASGASAPHDAIYVRYMTSSGDGITFCDGTTNTSGGPLTYTTYLYVSGNDLYCQVQPGTGATWNTAVPLISGVTDMVIRYGVSTSGVDTNIDTYVPPTSMTAAYWQNVGSVMVSLTFQNPLSASAGQPLTVSFRRVIGVMGRN